MTEVRCFDRLATGHGKVARPNPSIQACCTVCIECRCKRCTEKHALNALQSISKPKVHFEAPKQFCTMLCYDIDKTGSP